MLLARDVDQRVVRGHRVEGPVAEGEPHHVSLRERHVGDVLGGQLQLRTRDVGPDGGRRRVQISKHRRPLSATGVEDARRFGNPVEKPERTSRP